MLVISCKIGFALISNCNELYLYWFLSQFLLTLHELESVGPTDASGDINVTFT